MSFVIMVCTIAGCSSTPPEERFKTCFTALLDNDFEKMYAHFVFMDRATIAEKEFVETYSFSPTEANTLAPLRDSIGYKFFHLHVEGDTMRANISIHAPPFMASIVRLLLFRVDTIIDDPRHDPSYTLAEGLHTYRGALLMIKEGHAWFIHGNWDEQRQIETENAQARLDYMAEYLSTSKIRVSRTQEGQACLSLSLHNKGDRSVADVELYVIGYTKDNSPCFTETDHPLGAEPLKPRSIRRLSIDISQAPANWSGRVDLRILNCTFVKNSENE
jgi:hypothetical protein